MRDINQKILEREIQDGEEIVYSWEGLPKKRLLPPISEQGHRIILSIWLLVFGVALGWVLFRSDRREYYLTLMFGSMIASYLAQKFFLKKENAIVLSRFDLSVVTNRRVLVFDNTVRIANFPFSDFKYASTDLLSGQTAVRLYGRNKNEDVMFLDNQDLNLLEKLNPLIGLSEA